MYCEASAILHMVAEPQASVKATITVVAQKLGWERSRTYEIWYRRARRIDAYEMDALRKERDGLQARYASLARAMETADPEFYSAEITALVRQASRLGSLDT